jgi:hypothetical protein
VIATRRASSPRVIELANQCVPGDVLLHPVVLASIVVLMVNDHVLKAAVPGVLTGKLSDLGGVLFFPLLLVAGWELALAGLGRWRAPSSRSLFAAVAVTALAFACVKTTAIGSVAFAWGLGSLQWLVRSAWSSVLVAPQPRLQPVVVIQDPSDLVALVALVAAAGIGLARVRRYARASALTPELSDA